MKQVNILEDKAVNTNNHIEQLQATFTETCFILPTVGVHNTRLWNEIVIFEETQ